MKDYLIKNQAKFYNLIKNEFLQKRIPHAFLLVGNNTKIPMQYLAMSLVCDEDLLACEKCNDCRKIKEDKYADLIRFDGQNNTIKKKDIEYIQDTFTKSAIEGKGRLYILENIEAATKEAMNTLLKMLEEPSAGIYAIFTTNNPNRVLPTILSRCQVINIKPDSNDIIYDLLIQDNISNEAAKILSYLAADYQAAKVLYDERFEYMQTEVINFIEDLYTKKYNLVINVQTNLLKKYSKKEDIKLFLNMLVLAMKDLFHVKHNQKIVYVDHYQFFKNLNVDEQQLIKQLELVLETLYTLESNANLLMLMDSMMYHL